MSPRITVVLFCLGVLLGIASANPQYPVHRFQQRQYQQYPQQRQYPQMQGRTMGLGPLPAPGGDDGLGGPGGPGGLGGPGGPGGLGGPGGPGGPGDFPPPGAAGGVDPCAPNVLAGNRPDRVAH